MAASRQALYHAAGMSSLEDKHDLIALTMSAPPPPSSGQKAAKSSQNTLTGWVLPAEDALEAPDARWDPVTYPATTLCCVAHTSYDQDMHSLGVVDVPPELLAEMQKGSRRKQHFDTEAMQRVAEQMQFKTTDGMNFLQVGSNASVLTDNTHTMDGQESVCLVTSAAVEANLSRARQEFHRLSMTLRKMCPDHPVFDESTFSENAMDTSLFGSNKSAALQQLYKETRAKSFRLHACINKVKKSVSFDRHLTGSPPPSGHAAPPQAQVPQCQMGSGSGVVQGL
jgi:hypothetical protein